METQHSTDNNQFACNQPPTGLSQEEGRTTCARNTTGRDGGDFGSPKRAAKRTRFFAALTERRQQPGHCCRCGRKHDGKTKQCEKCLAYQARYRGRLADKNEKLTACMVVAMVKQMRREVTKLRGIIKQMQRVHRTRQQRDYLARRTVRKYADAYQPISSQELATMNHAYENSEA